MRDLMQVRPVANRRGSARTIAQRSTRRQVFTLDFASGRGTRRRYSRAKLIDMVFFQEGLHASVRTLTDGKPPPGLSEGRPCLSAWDRSVLQGKRFDARF